MPREDTQFRPGVSGNPQGRVKGRASARDAVRRALQKPAVEGDDRTRLDVWAERLVTSAVTTDDMLAVLKWLEGGAPTQDAIALERLAADLDDAEARLAEGVAE